MTQSNRMNFRLVHALLGLYTPPQPPLRNAALPVILSIYFSLSELNQAMEANKESSYGRKAVKLTDMGIYMNKE